MDTRVLPVTDESLALAREILLADGAVAFPTETVYGLGANAFSDAAVCEVYRVKGRPSDNPLIVHVSEDYDIGRLVRRVPKVAEALARAFLPGPLTLVYESRGTVSRFATCGLDTVAIRVPSHPAAEAFLRAAAMPIAAPSANRSKHVSPTSASHVFDDLAGKIPLILDGGASEKGIESTVLDVTKDVPVILRAGSVTAEQIAAVAGDCKTARAELRPGEKAPSPGMKYRHYRPETDTALFSRGEIAAATALAERAEREGKRVLFVAEDDLAAEVGADRLLSLGKGAEEAASRLYAALREGERRADLLIGIALPEEGVGAALMNRMKKAFGGKS